MPTFGLGDFISEEDRKRMLEQVRQRYQNGGSPVDTSLPVTLPGSQVTRPDEGLSSMIPARPSTTIDLDAITKMARDILGSKPEFGHSPSVIAKMQAQWGQNMASLIGALTHGAVGRANSLADMYRTQNSLRGVYNTNKASVMDSQTRMLDAQGNLAARLRGQDIDASHNAALEAGAAEGRDIQRGELQLGRDRLDYEKNKPITTETPTDKQISNLEAAMNKTIDDIVKKYGPAKGKYGAGFLGARNWLPGTADVGSPYDNPTVQSMIDETKTRYNKLIEDLKKGKTSTNDPLGLR